jgi:DNA ligase-1
MRRFTALMAELESAADDERRVAGLRRYLAAVPPADAACALALLWGAAALPAVSTRRLALWAAQAAGVPNWLLDHCRETAGDLAETAALLLPWPAAGHAPALHRLLDDWLGATDRRSVLLDAWQRLEPAARLMLNRLVSGGWSTPLCRRELVTTLAGHGGLPRALIARRLSQTVMDPGRSEWLEALLAPPTGAAEPDPAWSLAPSADLCGPPGDLGPAAAWMAEWLWPGQRVLLERAAEGAEIWLEDGTPLAGLLPDLTAALQALPGGTLLEAALVSWTQGRPGPASELERRLRAAPRRRPAPLALLAMDLLARDGRDMRGASRRQRRRELAALLVHAPHPQLRLSPELMFDSWLELESCWRLARRHGAVGVALALCEAPYTGVRAVRHAWPAPCLETSAVLLYMRSRPVADFTFGVWDGPRLVPLARTGLGLEDDAQRLELQAAIDAHIEQRRGPLTLLRPALVVSLAFDAIHSSPRHKSGLRLEGARMLRWRRATPAEAADRLTDLRAMLRQPLDTRDDPELRCEPRNDGQT